MVHAGLAASTKTPEMVLEEGEARMLADPLAQIAEHYNFAPSKEVQLAIALIGAAGMVYGPRVVNVRTRLKRERDERRKAAPGAGTVVRGPWPAAPSDPIPPVDPAAKDHAPAPGPTVPVDQDAANAFRFMPPEA